MGFPILVRWLLYIESGPRLSSCSTANNMDLMIVSNINENLLSISDKMCSKSYFSKKNNVSTSITVWTYEYIKYKPVNSLWPSNAIWWQIWVNIGSSNGLFPVVTKPLHSQNWFIINTGCESFTTIAQILMISITETGLKIAHWKLVTSSRC